MGDNLDDWLDAMDEEAKDKPPEGPTGEVVRNAMALNPKLAQKGEKAVREELEAAQKAEGMFADVPNTGINMTIAGLKPRFQQERARLRGKMTDVKQQMQLLPQRVLDRVIAAVLTHDPEMAKPQTLQLLQQHKRFLDAIGFSARKVIDAERKRR